LDEEDSDEARHAAIIDLAVVGFATLAIEPEANSASMNSHVLAAEGSDPVAAVVVRVLLTAGPQETRTENAQNGGEHPLASHSGQVQVVRYSLPQSRQGARERE
jgi:hypothetical protein